MCWGGSSCGWPSVGSTAESAEMVAILTATLVCWILLVWVPTCMCSAVPLSLSASPYDWHTHVWHTQALPFFFLSLNPSASRQRFISAGIFLKCWYFDADWGVNYHYFNFHAEVRVCVCTCVCVGGGVYLMVLLIPFGLYLYFLEIVCVSVDGWTPTHSMSVLH